MNHQQLRNGILLFVSTELRNYPLVVCYIAIEFMAQSKVREFSHSTRMVDLSSSLFHMVFLWFAYDLPIFLWFFLWFLIQ